ncbi:Gfo/Idh/MocA family oxidoreductase [Brachybacterium phenoliresistens]|uniref:Gfo/Idh/MocA family oxidoreductase n=1 Tax=Brachybacterium phenoliresistens TaxID=396014 RepID=UPI0031D60A73
MPKVLRVAVIGAGTMAQAVHLPVLRRRWDRFSVEALVDHSPRRRREASEAWGIPEEARYESVGDLIAAVRAKTVGIDMVVLATDGLHVEDVLTIVRRGIPVLVEPPVAFSEAELRTLADFERMTGRRLVVLAYPQQHDDAVAAMSGHIARKDLRMIDYEVLMPASQPLYSHAHVTTSAYDLPSEVRAQRRTALQEAVVAGTGEGATQRDRDLYVKGLLTGVAHQMAVLQKAYGPMTEILAVRHWPRGVIPGSIEILGELESGAPVRLVWHYLPFAPEYSERVRLLSARRRVEVDLAPPSFADRRSTVTLREKNAGSVTATTVVSDLGSAEAMWEDFYAFVTKGEDPGSGIPEALAELALMHEILDRIVTADGRSLEPEEVEAEENEADENEADENEADENEAGEAASEDATSDDAAPAAAASDGAGAEQPAAAGIEPAESERDGPAAAVPAAAEGGPRGAETAEPSGVGGSSADADADVAADAAPVAGAAGEQEPDADTVENPVAEPPVRDQVTEVLPDLRESSTPTASLPTAAPPAGRWIAAADPQPSEPASSGPDPVDPARAVDDVDAWNGGRQDGGPAPDPVDPSDPAGPVEPTEPPAGSSRSAQEGAPDGRTEQDQAAEQEHARPQESDPGRA